MLRVLSWAALALGFFVRAALLADKPFWEDEAWVVLLLRDPPAAAFTTQSPIPLGFLAVERLLAFLPGPPEVTLRLLPLVAGLAGLLLLARLTRRLGASFAEETIVLWLAAGAPALVHNSRELKHYSLDLLFAAGVGLLVLRVLEHRNGAPPDATGKPWIGLGLTLVLVPWVAYGAFFPTAAALIVAGATAWRPSPWTTRLRWGAIAAAFSVSLAAAYATAVRWQSGNQGLQDFWREEGASAGADLATVVHVVGRFVQGSLEYLFPQLVVPSLIVVAIGLWCWPRRKRTFFVCWFGLTSLLLCAAVLAGRYLIVRGRFLMCVAPFFILAAAVGLARSAAAVLRRAGGGAPFAGALAIAIVFSGYWSVRAVGHRLDPDGPTMPLNLRFDRVEDVDALVAATVARRAPGEPVFVSSVLTFPFMVYAGPRLSDATLARSRFHPEIDRWGTDALVRWLAGVSSRGWVLLRARSEPSRLEPLIRRAGFRIEQRAVGRGVLLWELVRLAPGTTAGR